MELFFIILTLLIVFIVKAIYDSRMNFRSLINRLEKNWGNPPEREYTSEKLHSMKAYYNSIKDDSKDVDDITWNDLDMDEVFFLMNNTVSSVGEEYLYAILRKLNYGDELLQERNQLIQFFEKNPKTAHKVQLELSRLGNLHNISVFYYISLFYNVKKDSTLAHFAMAAGLILSIGLIFFYPPVGGALTFIMVCNNVLRYYKRKGEIDVYLTVCSYILRMLNTANTLKNLNIKEIEFYTSELSKLEVQMRSFRKGAKYLGTSTGSGSLADSVLDYIRLLFHVDLIKFNGMLNSVSQNKNSLTKMFELIGMLDSMIAVASFRTMLPFYSLPVLKKKKENTLSVEELYHPLISEPVTNSVSVDRCTLVTGSNASGKSTFLKSVAINGILSQTIFTSLSRSYEANYYYIASSMALTDDIFSNESYYIVEIKSLKRILDKMNHDMPILCFVDEVLRGTNTLERVAASSQILYSFANSNVICFAATHDIELTYMLENYYSNYHFKEEVIDNDVRFDYRLNQGRATSKNAIKLLGIMGYSNNIIERAGNFANAFLDEGVWPVIP